MKKILLLSSALLLAFAFSASAAHATAFAHFMGKCSFSGSNLACNFDALRGSTPTSCAPSTVYAYCWDFGDGNSDCLTSMSAPSHTYTAPLGSAYTVKMTVDCADGSFNSQTRAVCIGAGVPGCIDTTGTWE
jgi:hypothetical protein